MKKLLFLLLSVFLCISCSDDNTTTDEPTPNPGEPQIEIPATSLAPNFKSEGGKSIIEFTAKSDWSVSVVNTRAESWCSVSPLSGKAGKASLTIRTTANETYDERNATITLRAGTDSKNIIVTQKQKDALLVSSSKIEMKKEGGEFTIEVKANVTFSHSIDEGIDWISAATADTRGLTTTQLKFSVSANTSVHKREAGITVTDGTLSERITVYQEGEEPQLTATASQQTFGPEGGTLKIEINSNVDYETLLPDASWIAEDQARNQSTHTLYFTISPNETYDNRQADIVFKDKESELADTVRVMQHGKQNNTEINIKKLLMKIYNSAGGNNWTRKKNWGENTSIRFWDGISILTDEQDNIIQLEIQLSDNNLVGTIDLSSTNIDIPFILHCNNNKLTQINLKANNNIKELNCSYNLITAIDVGECNILEILRCNHNNIVSLSTSGLTKLSHFECSYNPLTSLDISNCTSLEWEHIWGLLECPLVILKASNTSYTSIKISRNKSFPESLQIIDLSHSDNLTKIETAWETYTSPSLKSIDISHCKNLKYVSCGYGCENLESLNIEGSSNIEELYCSYTKIPFLEFIDYPHLQECWIEYSMSFKNLSFRNCPSLTRIICNYCALENLNIEECPQLTYLGCNDNQLTGLDLRQNLKLKSLWCQNNFLTAVAFPASLEFLDCRGNHLNSVIPKWFSEIPTFFCDWKYKYTHIGEDGKWRYETFQYGWWYDGEPECGPVYHF